ncbi:MAG: CDP-alcohol phosphatidyltransferase family protein [Ignavibacteriae bacterium]|nr:CDP-alcohol phosphatidyltransferase family protein [Ignavibacteriota bacterium]
MNRPSPIQFFRETLKSDKYYADELINIYLLRPLAAMFVWLIYPTAITPNQVTLLAIVVGFASAYTYTFNTPTAIANAGLLVVAKDIIDDADGQLARAKQMYSRRGRFLDSIGDFVVDVAIFSAITFVVYRSEPSLGTILLGLLSLAGITLRVSYHVFYQVSFLHLEERYKLNRITEEITEEDRRGDQIAFRLQQLFVLIYGWQDRLMYKLDAWCRGNISSNEELQRWYCDKFGLRLSGLLGFGTELTLLGVCSLFNQLYLYFLLNVFLMNGILLFSVMYRRVVIRKQVSLMH